MKIGSKFQSNDFLSLFHQSEIYFPLFSIILLALQKKMRLFFHRNWRWFEVLVYISTHDLKKKKLHTTLRLVKRHQTFRVDLCRCLWEKLLFYLIMEKNMEPAFLRLILTGSKRKISRLVKNLQNFSQVEPNAYLNF